PRLVPHRSIARPRARFLEAARSANAVQPNAKPPSSPDERGAPAVRHPQDFSARVVEGAVAALALAAAAADEGGRAPPPSGLAGSSSSAAGAVPSRTARVSGHAAAHTAPGAPASHATAPRMSPKVARGVSVRPPSSEAPTAQPPRRNGFEH